MIWLLKSVFLGLGGSHPSPCTHRFLRELLPSLQSKAQDLGSRKGLLPAGTPSSRASLHAFCMQYCWSSAAAWETWDKASTVWPPLAARCPTAHRPAHSQAKQQAPHSLRWDTTAVIQGSLLIAATHPHNGRLYTSTIEYGILSNCFNKGNVTLIHLEF